MASTCRSSGSPPTRWRETASAAWPREWMATLRSRSSPSSCMRRSSDWPLGAELRWHITRGVAGQWGTDLPRYRPAGDCQQLERADTLRTRWSDHHFCKGSYGSWKHGSKRTHDIRCALLHHFLERITPPCLRFFAISAGSPRAKFDLGAKSWG